MYNRLFLEKETERGQTLIEALVALSTAVVIVSAITLSLLTSLRNVQHTETQSLATRYSQEGMEYMRFFRDGNYAAFDALQGNTTYCLGKRKINLEESSTSYTNPNCGDNVDLFSRAIVIDKDSAECAPLTPPPPTPVPLNTAAKVTVIVSWTDSACPNSSRCHTSVLESCFSNYTVVSTPGDTSTPTPTPTP